MTSYDWSDLVLNIETYGPLCGHGVSDIHPTAPNERRDV